jgi:hypothetical protein
MTPCDRAHKIQIAADMIHDEMFTLGTHISAADALHLATRLHELWEERVEVLHLEPGEVARRFRERYEQQPRDVADYLRPLLDDQP